MIGNEIHGDDDDGYDDEDDDGDVEDGDDVKDVNMIMEKADFVWNSTGNGHDPNDNREFYGERRSVPSESCLFGWDGAGGVAHES